MTTTVQRQVAVPPVTSAPPRRPLASGGGWFTVPYLVAFVLFLVGPVVYGLYMAFTDQSLTGSGGSLVGVSNFGEALQDPQVWSTLANTVAFTLMSSVPLVVLSLALALLVHAVRPGQWLWRLTFFAPFLLPVTVVTILWTWMYQPDLGLFNAGLGALGADGIGWLTDENIALWSIALTTVWWTLGFNFLLYLAALQNIPQHLYEAASIDGAGTWRRLFSVTLPMLARTTSLVVILQLLASLKVFDQIYLMTMGGPNNSTRSILEYVYDTGFTNYRLGYAAAISYVFFALIVVLSLAQGWFMSRREGRS
jgi:multiple sugar transport system permease protein